MKLSENYTPRPIRFLELFECEGYRLKIYGITYQRQQPRPELIEAAKLVASQFLRTHRTRQTTYGVGFLGIHDGRGENQVFLDRWCNENELLHQYWVSPTDDPVKPVIPDADHNSVCVWDLALQCFEREAWMGCVLKNPRGPDIEAYLARHADMQV